MDERINEFIQLKLSDIKNMFEPFDRDMMILGFSPMRNGMGNSGYEVTTTNGKFLLKLYSNNTHGIETAMYNYMEKIINVPKVYYYHKNGHAYTITEYIEGETLSEYIRREKKYPKESAFTIGNMCGFVHSKKYSSDAMLDTALNVLSTLPLTREKILFLLNSKPGSHLQKETIAKLQSYIEKHSEELDEIESESVLLHGDMNYGNIMLSGGKVYFIDFEFAFSGSRYHDIGHFFRRKDADLQIYIDTDIYTAFADGYNSVSEKSLPENWLRLARLCDISAMLCLLNHNNIPEQWVTDIEYDILCAIKEYNYDKTN